MAQCTAKSKRSGNQCRRDAMHGCNVCHMHGGSAPQVLAAAERRLTKANLDGEIGRLLAELEDDDTVPHIDGLVEACELARRMVAVLKWAAGSRDPLAKNRFDEDVADPLVEMYGTWLDRYARATKLALDAGIDERRTRLSEIDSKRLFDVITAALDSAQLNAEQEARFRGTLAAGLRSLGA